MSDETPLLTGVQVFDCRTCRGRGRLRNTVCPDCQGRRVVVIQRGRVVALTSQPRHQDAKPTKEQVAATDRAADASRHAQTRTRRKANVVCIKCESPNLETPTLCYACNEKRKGLDRRYRRGSIA